MCKDDDERRTDDMSSLFSLSSDERTNERTGKETKRHPEKPLLKSFLREERDLFSTTLNVSLSLVHKKKNSHHFCFFFFFLFWACIIMTPQSDACVALLRENTTTHSKQQQADRIPVRLRRRVRNRIQLGQSGPAD